MKIFAYTWNTHGFFQIPAIDTSADLYIVSLQECLSTPSLGKLADLYDYKSSFSFCGLQTLVFGKADFKCKFTRLALGPLFLPNKGCIASVINASILHINVHLSAHPENQPTRMEQIRMILELIYRPSYETVIFTGDFNFRIVQGKDQSLDFIERYPIFKEGRIDFKPSYKYEGSNLSIKRAPSYCDRIYVFSQRDLSFIRYNSSNEVVSSDHKPVYCEFKLGFLRDEMKFINIKQSSSIILFYISDIYQWLWENRRLIISGLFCLIAYFLYLHKNRNLQ
ncbi:hypothetical protein PAEPH01_1933 [Pancytospora epiphaga]|nr:hypothetical protein PAEPH01_1933 [Pancytospora epiphaga]